MYNLPSILKDGVSPIYLSVNIQSLNSKFDELRMQILELVNKNVQIDAIALQEVWEIRDPLSLIIPGFQPLVCKTRTNMRGGGIGFYVKEGINFKIMDNLSPFEPKIFEALTIQLFYPSTNKSVLLTSAYRSNGIIPNVTANQQMERFSNLFDELLYNLNRKNVVSYIFIDSNIDLLNLYSDEAASFLNSIFTNGYLQNVMKCSRIQNNSKSLIDHILSSSKSSLIYSGTIISDISDHFFTFVKLNCPHEKHREKTTSVRQFSQVNLNNFKMALGGTDWSPVLNSNNVESAYDEFWSIYLALYELTFPKKKMRFNKNFNKRFQFRTNGLLISRRTKNNLYKKQIIDNSPQNVEKYKKFKQIYFKTLRAAKTLYFRKKLQDNLKNPRKTWETLNEVLGKEKSCSTIEKINIDGTTCTDKLSIANHFNRFFTRIGSDISNSIQPIAKQPEDFIQYNREIPSLNLTNTTPEHVNSVIKGLASKKSCDVYGTSTKMIKTIGDVISIPLSHIFNLSLASGEFPSKLKKCRVIPIFKSGNVLECDNYRPISLLSSISKILEKIVAEKLLHHLLSNDLLYQHQYGFLPKRSTEHNLIQIINYISEAINENMYCIGVFLDLKKAFDVCSHEILLKKLKKMGIEGVAHKWFTNYLQGRSQCVDIEGNLSDFLNLDISVIQGSTLGPILFLCYINDFWTCTAMFSVLFADDTTSLAKGPVLKDLTNFVNIELRKMANWFRANKMSVNASKTKFIIFKTQNKPVNPQDCLIVYNSNEIGHQEDPSKIYQIDRISNEGDEKHFKLLGVLLDENLSFKAHIDMLCTKISKSLYCINRVKNLLDRASLRKLYFSMVHSYLSYGINIYGCATTTSLDKLRKMQKKAIRVICNASYRAHTAPLFKELKILPLDELIKYSNVKFMHFYYLKQLPMSFNGMWITNEERNPERVLRNANDLYVPAHRLEMVKRMPLFAFPTVWNNALGNKNNRKHHAYMRELKSLLLSNL
jgi:hypothetical protein